MLLHVVWMSKIGLPCVKELSRKKIPLLEKSRNISERDGTFWSWLEFCPAMSKGLCRMVGKLRETCRITNFRTVDYPCYTPGIYAEGYIVFVFPFVCSYVRSFVCSFVRSFVRSFVLPSVAWNLRQSFALKFLK